MLQDGRYITITASAAGITVQLTMTLLPRNADGYYRDFLQRHPPRCQGAAK
jgi:hypothetical protein